MSYEAWPSPDSQRGPLPRIDDLRIADQGYDQEAVREAFDAFYRHAAQLDASLKALEAVEVFRRDAMELRNDLRSIRSLGLGAAEPTWTSSSWAVERPRLELPTAVPRLAAEASLVIAVAVVAGVAHFRAWLIVLLMAIAWTIVAVSEWLAARARTRVPASIYEPLVLEEPGEPAPYVETPAPDPGVGWSAFEPALEPIVEPPDDVADEDAEELTMVEQAPPEEPAPAAAAPPVDAEAQPRRRGLLRRRRPGDERPAEATAAPPSNVRVLEATERDPADPWEHGLDGGGPEAAAADPNDTAGPIKRRR